MAEKIEESERRAIAAAEVSEVLTGDSLEQQFAQLKPAEENVEFRLLQLKERMGLPSAGAARPALTGGNTESAAQPQRQVGPGSARESGPVRDAEIEEEA
jgi:hypothetical protein